MNPTPDNLDAETEDDPRLLCAAQEYLAEVEVGRRPLRSEFVARFPGLGAELTPYLEAIDLLHAGPTGGSLRLQEAVEDTLPVEPLGDFRLMREIGRGGMGIVYEALQLSLGRRVALKVLSFAAAMDAKQLERFRNEAQAAAHLHHTNIVPVFAVGSERGVHYYAMQLIEGQNLADLIRQITPSREAVSGRRNKEIAKEAATPSPDGHYSANAVTAAGAEMSTQHATRSGDFYRAMTRLMVDAAEALEYAHKHGVIHRDVKPANLMLDAGGHLWVTDFGLAQFHTSLALTRTGDLLGTLRYMSPEQAGGQGLPLDQRTDIYSLGATFYELLTLEPLLDGGDHRRLLRQILEEEPRPPRSVDPSIPRELETIVLKAVNKSAADRYSTALEFADDLRRFLDHRPILAKRPSLTERVRKWGRRHPSVVVATVLLLLVGLIAFAVSTIVIAREQWKTQAAYEKLDAEEKETKAAYAKLANEEKRTKEAYSDLTVEQTRTKAAYDAEERQRRLAEWDFDQAQRAIALVVQFSEGELAHKPDQQDVRRRLLVTVLDYYEDFLKEHTDDPGLQAARERVAELVTELSRLRGATLITIVRDAIVQKDLKLTEEQKKQLSAYVDSQAKPPTPKDKGPRPMEAASVVEQALGEILNLGQMKRFQEIVLQVQHQGRYGFSDPKIVETLNLTTGQRERIRQIQTEAHQAWAEHSFSDRKIKKPVEFWAGVQARILAVFDADQRRQWQQLAGAPIAVEYREGYPFDGKTDDHPLPRRDPPFAWQDSSRGAISVMLTEDHAGDHAGSGFGHKKFVDDKQYYSWLGKEIPPTAFEIAVTGDPLTEEERAHLVTKGDHPRPERKDRHGWMVLFRSDDPSVWNTDSPDKTKFAIPVVRAPRDVRYLRLKRMDTGEVLIVSIRHADLAQPGKWVHDQDFVWNGSAKEAWGGRHLGIGETRPLRGRPPKDPPKEDPEKRPPPG